MKKIVPLVAIIVVIYTIGFFTLKKSDLLNGSQSAAVLKADQAYLKTFDAQKVSSIVSPDGPAMTVGNDLCPNIAGTQNVVPAGYQLVNGQCVVIDVCPNIPGDQATVPAGNTIIGGKCYSVREVNLPVTTKTRPNLGIPVGPVVTTPPTGVCVNAATGQLSNDIAYFTGGHNRSVGFADFFSLKTNPIQWTQLLSSSSFGDKAHHASALFENKLWVIGGTRTIPGGYVASNEIWTYDGALWHQETSPFSARYDLSAEVFQNKLWVMGGSDSSNGLPHNQSLFGDIWTFNGTGWTQWDANPATTAIDAPPWAITPGRVGLSYLGVSTWNSTRLSGPRTGRTAFKTAVFNNKLWLMGGVKDLDVSQNGNRIDTGSFAWNDVWSFDGTTWSQFDNNSTTFGIQDAPWSRRSDFVLVSFQNKLWLMGGENDARNIFHDVWSFDGTTWTNHGNAPWPARAQFDGIVQNGKLYIFGGDDNTNLLNDIWSFDGTTWTQVDVIPGTSVMDNAPWSIRDGMSVVSCQQ